MTGRGWRTTGFILGAVVGGSALLVLLSSPRLPAPSGPSSASPVEALSGPVPDGFARAVEPRAFRFPEDHGPHPEYRNEWWYLAGHLDAPGGESFGFHVTFFRISLSPDSPESESEWATNQMYMAHFALTDVGEGVHHAFERMARGAVGMAGARGDPFRVWVDDWLIEGNGEGNVFPMRVRAARDGVAVDLELLEGKPMVLQGHRGLSPKGSEPGNASYYYSFTRLPVQGAVTVGGRTLSVQGKAWMDREWSTSPLTEEHRGWDWFALQLEDGRDLMYFELRRDDGTPDPFDYGIVVAADGSTRTLPGPDVELEVLDHWRSPRDGVRYPSHWRLSVPDEGLDVELRPRVADQEMNLTFRYWEGALEVVEVGEGDRLLGRGYAELTGYAEGRGPSL